MWPTVEEFGLICKYWLTMKHLICGGPTDESGATSIDEESETEIVELIKRLKIEEDEKDKIHRFRLGRNEVIHERKWFVEEEDQSTLGFTEMARLASPSIRSLEKTQPNIPEYTHRHLTRDYGVVGTSWIQIEAAIKELTPQLKQIGRKRITPAQRMKHLPAWVSPGTRKAMDDLRRERNQLLKCDKSYTPSHEYAAWALACISGIETDRRAPEKEAQHLIQLVNFMHEAWAAIRYALEIVRTVALLQMMDKNDFSVVNVPAAHRRAKWGALSVEDAFLQVSPSLTEASRGTFESISKSRSEFLAQPRSNFSLRPWREQYDGLVSDIVNWSATVRRLAIK